DIPDPPTEPTDSDGRTLIQYPYRTDKNSPFTDKITAIITEGIAFSQTTVISWIPVTMTLKAPPVSTQVSDSTQVSGSTQVSATLQPWKNVTLRATLPMTIVQTDLGSSNSIIKQVIQIPVPGQHTFVTPELVEPILPFNRIYPGCDIKFQTD